jgi:glycosidase
MDTWQYVPNAFWKKWTAAVKKEFPNFKVIGEVKDGDVVHTSFFQGGAVRFDGVDSGLDSLLDFPLFYSIRHAFAEGKALDEVPKTLAKDYLYTNPNILVTLLGGHDDGRFMSEHGATVTGLKLANALVLTTRGVPQLYYGDEIAMTGADEPTTRGDFPGGFPGDARNAFTREGRTAEEQEAFEFIQKLTQLRHELEPLRSGRLVNLYVSPQQYAYARIVGKSVVIVAFNNDEKAEQFAFDVSQLGLMNGTSLKDRLAPGANIVVGAGKISLTLPPRSVSIFAQ